jgi:hypothetical protein
MILCMNSHFAIIAGREEVLLLNTNDQSMPSPLQVDESSSRKMSGVEMESDTWREGAALHGH